MVYRARITKILSAIEERYNFNKFNVVQDKYDYYIEVKDPDEADLIEEMNTAMFNYNVAVRCLDSYLSDKAED